MGHNLIKVQETFLSNPLEFKALSLLSHAACCVVVYVDSYIAYMCIWCGNNLLGTTCSAQLNYITFGFFLVNSS